MFCETPLIHPLAHLNNILCPVNATFLTTSYTPSNTYLLPTFSTLLCLVLKKVLDFCDISPWKYSLVPGIGPHNILGTSEWLITSQLILNPHKSSFSHSLGSPKGPISTYIPHFASIPCLWIPMPTKGQEHPRLAFWGSVPEGVSMPRPCYWPSILSFYLPHKHLCSVTPHAMVKCSSYWVPALNKTYNSLPLCVFISKWGFSCLLIALLRLMSSTSTSSSICTVLYRISP